MNNIKYSIIIPHYNIPELLVRCINSIPERKDVQVIIVDDNSPNSDSYKEYLEKESFRKNFELYLTHQGRGAGYARNIGLSHVKGEWVLFADADDFFVDGFLSLLDENADSNADIIYFNVKSVMSDDIKKPATRNVSKNKLFEKYAQTGDETPFRCEYCEPWGKMLRYDFVHKNNIRFDETKVSNDYYFSVVSGCLAKNITVVNKPLYVITQREGSLSFKYGDTMEKLFIRLDVATRVQLFCERMGYVQKPMPIRGLMVLLLKRNIMVFLKELFKIQSKGISVFTLLNQMFSRKYMK